LRKLKKSKIRNRILNEELKQDEYQNEDVYKFQLLLK